MQESFREHESSRKLKSYSKESAKEDKRGRHWGF